MDRANRLRGGRKQLDFCGAEVLVCGMKSAPRILLVGILAGSVTLAHAVELSVRNLRVHLADSLTNTDEAATRGVSITMKAPAGKKFLCVVFDLFGTNWAEGERNTRLAGDEFVLESGGQTFQNAGQHNHVTGSFFLNPQGAYLPKGNGDGGESFRPLGPMFIVPEDFSEGILKIGKNLKVGISASDAVAFGKVADLADFSVRSATFVDGLEKPERIDNENTTAMVKPVNGRILVLRIDIRSKASFSFQTAEFAVSANGVSTSSSGVIRRGGGASIGTSGYSPMPGTVLEAHVFFVIPSDAKDLSLSLRGEKVAEFSVGP